LVVCMCLQLPQFLTLILGFELAQMQIQNQNIYHVFQNLLLDGVSTLTT
jgi:hypothetical protein